MGGEEGGAFLKCRLLGSHFDDHASEREVVVVGVVLHASADGVPGASLNGAVGVVRGVGVGAKRNKSFGRWIERGGYCGVGVGAGFVGAPDDDARAAVEHEQEVGTDVAQHGHHAVDFWDVLIGESTITMVGKFSVKIDALAVFATGVEEAVGVHVGHPQDVDGWKCCAIRGILQNK